MAFLPWSKVCPRLKKPSAVDGVGWVLPRGREVPVHRSACRDNPLERVWLQAYTTVRMPSRQEPHRLCITLPAGATPLAAASQGSRHRNVADNVAAARIPQYRTS